MQTDRRSDGLKLIVVFHSFMKAPNASSSQESQKFLFQCSYHTVGYVVSVIKLIRHSAIEMHETIGNIHGLKL